MFQIISFILLNPNIFNKRKNKRNITNYWYDFSTKFALLMLKILLNAKCQLLQPKISVISVVLAAARSRFWYDFLILFQTSVSFFSIAFFLQWAHIFLNCRCTRDLNIAITKEKAKLPSTSRRARRRVRLPTSRYGYFFLIFNGAFHDVISPSTRHAEPARKPKNDKNSKKSPSLR